MPPALAALPPPHAPHDLHACPHPLEPTLGPLLGQVVRGGEEKQQQLLAADFPIARMFREMSSWAHLPAESDEAASRKEVDP